MPIERIRDDADDEEVQTATVQNGPYKGMEVRLVKRATSGWHIQFDNGNEGYIFHSEFKPATRRIK